MELYGYSDNLLIGRANFRTPDSANNIRDVNYYIGHSAQVIRELVTNFLLLHREF